MSSLKYRVSIWDPKEDNGAAAVGPPPRVFFLETTELVLRGKYSDRNFPVKYAGKLFHLLSLQKRFYLDAYPREQAVIDMLVAAHKAGTRLSVWIDSVLTFEKGDKQPPVIIVTHPSEQGAAVASLSLEEVTVIDHEPRDSRVRFSLSARRAREFPKPAKEPAAAQQAAP